MVPVRQERPYHSDSTASRLLSEVKHCRARLVLRWGTTLESLVLFFCSFCRSFWPLPCAWPAYNTIHYYTYYLPAFVLSFARPSLFQVWWPNFASLEMREVVIKIRSEAGCVVLYVCPIVRLSSVIQTYIYERCMWLHLHEKRYPLSATYVVDRS